MASVPTVQQLQEIKTLLMLLEYSNKRVCLGLFAAGWKYPFFGLFFIIFYEYRFFRYSRDM
uniref:Uncharacterized protein n=1 Tax=Anguilla anguilla TaxID=7936 RepID=A0A0E9PFE8_ANGAN